MLVDIGVGEMKISTGHLVRPYATGRVQLWCFIFTRGRCLGAWLRGGRCLSLRLRGDRSRRLRSVLFAGIEHSPAKYGKGRKHTYSHDTHYYVPLIPEAGAGLARQGSIGHDTPSVSHLDACTTNPHPQGSNASLSRRGAGWKVGFVRVNREASLFRL
jgi:hypothetical protein